MPGRNKAFLKYYEKYKDKIYTYFLYRVNFNRTVAEDLTSEIFLKTFEHFEHFDQSRSFQAWIYKIASNHLVNYYRTCRREVGLDFAENIAGNCQNRLNASLELENIITKIMAMDEYYREVLLLRFIDGLDNTEIADVLGKDEGAVRTQVSRALSRLRTSLENEQTKI